MPMLHHAEDVFGTAPEKLPRFAELLRRTRSYHDSVPTHIDEAERSATAEALLPFFEVLAGAGFEPLVMELAVIEDRRLRVDYENPGPRGARKEGQEFLSLLCGVSDTQANAPVLAAWNAAMRRVLEPAAEKPAPIVPHPGTYGTGTKKWPYVAYLTGSLHDAVERVQLQLVAQSISVDSSTLSSGDGADRLASGSAELSLALSLGGKWLSHLGNGAEPPETAESASTQRPSFLANRYEYALLDAETVGPVESTIRSLLTHFAHEVAVLALGSGKAEFFEALLQHLKCCELLIVPFRRPQGQGLRPWEGRAQLERSTSHGPGGCLFVVLRPNEGQTPSQWDLRHLAIKLGWLLGRSSLLEAHAEIELRIQRQKTVGSWSHTLSTEARVAEAALTEALECNRTRDLERLGHESGTHIETALSSVRRFRALTSFAVLAEKATETGKAQVSLKLRQTPDELIASLSAEVEATWRRLLSGGVPVAEGWKERSAPSISLNSRSNDNPAMVLLSNEQHIWIVLTECIRNVLQHGEPSSDWGPQLELSIREPEANLRTRAEAVLRIRNQIPEGKVSRAQDAAAGRSWHVGLSSLEFAARACGFPTCLQEVEGAAFMVEVIVGVAE